MYGIELTATGMLVLYGIIDVCSHGAHDGVMAASPHVGAALCGWFLGEQWKRNLPVAWF